MKKEIGKLLCFSFEVSSFVMDGDGQGRSYFRNYLYSGLPAEAWEKIEEKISDEIENDPERDTPCSIKVIAYEPGDSSPIVKKISVKNWEAVRKAYEKWFEKTVA